MGLSCGICDDGDGDWSWIVDEDFSQAKVRCDCSSCETAIEPKETVLHFETIIYDESGDETRGNNDFFLCEECGGIFMSLEVMGFCLTLDYKEKNWVKNLLAEYIDYYSPPKLNNQLEKQHD